MSRPSQRGFCPRRFMSSAPRSIPGRRWMRLVVARLMRLLRTSDERFPEVFHVAVNSESQPEVAKMMQASRLTVVVFGAIVLIVGFSIGFLSGYYSESTSERKERERTSNVSRLWAALSGEDIDPTVSQRLMDDIRPENIRQHHRYITSKPHLAGTQADHELAEHIAREWRSYGLTSVRLVPYRVLLSYPNATDPNRIMLMDSASNSTLFTTQLVEKIVRPEQNHSDVVPPFNVYSPPGNPRGNLVYVNYGRVEDFMWLAVNASVELNGSICIARYGKIFRANKVVHAQQFGCIGMIFYSDPADYAVDGVSSVYPDSWWLPGTGVQRGTAKVSHTGLGDPLTPFYPATESAFRIDISEADLPKIPAHPIGYDDAKELLRGMSGPEVPPSWRGKLNITYRYGPGHTNNNWKVEMRISTQPQMVTINNVVGFIEGRVEPDRYVIIGNHYDAFVFGAVDPNSGTAVMLELSRAYGQLVKDGWRPRRTIVFCAWGAEEQGVVGSREWVENFGQILGDRTVAYLNIDIAVQGSFVFRARALPLLNNVIYAATKTVPNPDETEYKKGFLTVYDTWLRRNCVNCTKPKLPTLGSGSDFAPFIGSIGVTCSDFRYHFDESLSISSYPLYHSVYETNHLFETYIDPVYNFSVAVGRVWGEVARRLAEPVLLPFSVTSYSTAVAGYARELETGYGKLLRLKGMQAGLGYLAAAVNSFNNAAKAFEQRLSEADVANPMLTRQLNDQMMQLERAFIDPSGLPNRPAMKHVLFAPSIHNSYAGATFPGLIDSLFGLTEETTDEASWQTVRKQLSIVTFVIEAAAASLVKPTDFSG